ncbi:MAG: NADH-quinone oxidoreductase subunit C, partial [Alistipes sp.]|nr:NADH-quinone oxidoreductase subunit C [Alistipes sp.]
MNYYITDNLAGSIALKDIPEVEYAALYNDLKERLKQENYHVAHYFATPDGDRLRFYMLLLDDAAQKVMVASFAMDYYEDVALPSLTALHPALHVYEREIAELYNVEFDSMPWNKPLRFPFNRRNRNSTMDNYPFYSIDGESLHEVNVGPIHAG